MVFVKKTILRKYANLIAKCGVNVQKGQEVFINTELNQPEFVRMLVEECYKLGASRVYVEWSYQPLAKIHTRYRTLKNMSEVTDIDHARLQHMVDKVPCMIYLESEDPDGNRGINQEKLAKSRQKRYPITKKYTDQIENKYQWCIAAVPGVEWAKKLFPNIRASQAVERLWEAILMTSRVDDDPIKAWEDHNADLAARCEHLNSLGIEELHYVSSNGTDFTVGMIPEAEFMGGGETSLQGYYFNPNIPSEECFVSPMRGKAEGTVVSTKPLSYMGELIENFSVRFENGKAVEWHAEQNEDLLTKMITMDEGAAYLGEVALIPVDSPISNSGLLFYNTLFDENASCHLALGRGFENTLKGYENMTLEECHKMGVNDSMIHVDFMIGADDLSIDAKCRDGKTVPIFRNGNWAF